MEVYDLCLAFLGPAVAYLRVSDIQELELDLIDKVRVVGSFASEKQASVLLCSPTSCSLFGSGAPSRTLRDVNRHVL